MEAVKFSTGQNYACILWTQIFRIHVIEYFKIFFTGQPFTATYCASKHALQVCNWAQNAVKQSFLTIVSYTAYSHSQDVA